MGRWAGWSGGQAAHREEHEGRLGGRSGGAGEVGQGGDGARLSSGTVVHSEGEVVAGLAQTLSFSHFFIVL